MTPQTLKSCPVTSQPLNWQPGTPEAAEILLAAEAENIPIHQIGQLENTDFQEYRNYWILSAMDLFSLYKIRFEKFSEQEKAIQARYHKSGKPLTKPLTKHRLIHLWLRENPRFLFLAANAMARVRERQTGQKDYLLEDLRWVLRKIFTCTQEEIFRHPIERQLEKLLHRRRIAANGGSVHRGKFRKQIHPAELETIDTFLDSLDDPEEIRKHSLRIAGREERHPVYCLSRGFMNEFSEITDEEAFQIQAHCLGDSKEAQRRAGAQRQRRFRYLLSEAARRHLEHSAWVVLHRKGLPSRKAVRDACPELGAFRLRQDFLKKFAPAGTHWHLKPDAKFLECLKDWQESWNRAKKEISRMLREARQMRETRAEAKTRNRDLVTMGLHRRIQRIVEDWSRGRVPKEQLT